LAPPGDPIKKQGCRRARDGIDPAGRQRGREPMTLQRESVTSRLIGAPGDLNSRRPWSVSSSEPRVADANRSLDALPGFESGLTPPLAQRGANTRHVMSNRPPGITDARILVSGRGPATVASPRQCWQRASGRENLLSRGDGIGVHARSEIELRGDSRVRQPPVQRYAAPRRSVCFRNVF